MLPSHKTGGEVDAFCSSCRLELAHTILAMVGVRIARVRCNTCHKEHALRARPDAAAARHATATAPRKTSAAALAQTLPPLDASKARAYAPKETFAEGEVVSHPQFGLGLVQAVRGEKMDVVFQSGAKTLVHKKIPPAQGPT